MDPAPRGFGGADELLAILRDASRAGDPGRVSSLILSDGVPPELLKNQIDMTMLGLSGFQVRQAVFYPFEDFVTSQKFTYGGKLLDFARKPDVVIRVDLEYQPEGLAPVVKGELVIPAIEEDGRFWIVGFKYAGQ